MLRFRPPEPPGAWSETRDATRFGPAAPQNPDPLDHIYGEVLAPGDEDCLTLNVWTPAADGGKRPVMVCIHGGAFLIGSGRWPWYEGSELVRRGDVVLVTINYRLGALGFLDLSVIGGEGYATSGNHGLLDQVAALRWVRDNIERFGGDPGNVTVFGESAGGISISCLMAMPAARGLFRRAIAMSGGPNLVRFPGTSRVVAEEFRQLIGVRDVDGLRAVPTKALLKAQKRYLRRNEFGGDLVFGPVVDSTVLPEPPLHAIRAGCARDVALLVGTTLDEARLWSLYVPILRWTRPNALERILGHAVGNRWRELIATYRHSRPGEKAGNLTMAINGDLLFRMPAIRLAEAQSAHRPEDTRMYLFAWKTPVLGGRLGAPHAVEIPFVFGNLNARGVNLYTGNGEDRRPLSNLV
jgi:para-nitrobenzyl esterase